MIISNLIERVATGYSKGVSSDDTRLSDEYVYSIILSMRNKLISQQARKNQKISQASYQTLNCVMLKKAPIYDCPCLPPVGCQIYKTVTPLPKPLTDLNDHLIQSVSSVTGGVQYDEVTWEEKKYKSGRKYTASKPDFLIRDHHLIVTQQVGLGLISITGLWEDPLEAYRYPSYCEDCEGDACYDCESPLDKEFPIDGDMISTLISMAINELKELFLVSREDRTNNSADSDQQESK